MTAPRKEVAFDITTGDFEITIVFPDGERYVLGYAPTRAAAVERAAAYINTLLRKR